MIYAIGIFIITLMVKLAIDVKLWMDGKANQHKLGSAIVFAVLTLCSYLAGWISVPMWFFVWWALFDSLYGKLIGEGFFYLGSTSWLDRLQNDFKPLKIAKYVLAAITLIFFIYVRISQ